MVDNNTRAILELSKRVGNETCADCGIKEPEWASYNIGIFVCGTCASVHRSMGAHVSKVKHLRLDRWEDSQLQRMRDVGNLQAKLKYEKRVPPCYRVPLHGDPVSLLEEWILGKYLREEFSRNERQPFMSGHMEGFLMKRGKEDPRYYPRRFTLSQLDDSLKYYVKENKEPKAVLKVSDLNVCFAPEKMEKRNSLQISFMKDGLTRHIYVYHEDPQTIVNWYNAVRCTKLHRLQVQFPDASQQELATMLTKDFTLEGWLWKTGPKPTDAYKKRWFTLDQRKLMYHEEPLAAHPKGEIYLGKSRDGYSVKRADDAKGGGGKEHGFVFRLCTPDRTYQLSAETAYDRDLWIDTLASLLETNPTLYDTDVAARLVRNKKCGTGSLNIFSSR